MSEPIKFISSDVGTGNHSPLCYFAMFATKDGISHAWRSHWIRFHRGDGCVRNTRLLMLAADDTNICPETSIRSDRLIATIWVQDTIRNYATMQRIQYRAAYLMSRGPIW